MDPDNPVVKLCVAGMRAEDEGRMAEARCWYDLAAERLDQAPAGRYGGVVRAGIENARLRVKNAGDVQ